ncbi:MAG: hypothetical protein HYW85_04820 [Deltaproteobacteria bacterium]|nr:hypothetical protein [Deltaproteobacteria bacterium]
MEGVKIMRINKIFFASLGIGVALDISIACAGGNVGNGGWGLIRDNEVILADPFFKVPNYDGVGERWTLGPELKSYLEHIASLLGAYGVPKVYLDEVLSDIKPPAWKRHIDNAEIKRRVQKFGSRYRMGSPFWFDNVFSEQTEYRYTEELPCNDPFELISDVKGEPVLLGCTIENITWFKKSLFEKLNLKHQSLAIIHERLHAQSPKPHRIISDFISILDLMLTLQNNQLKGELPQLTEEELHIISRLKERAMELGLYVDIKGRVIWPNGGGIINNEVGYEMTISDSVYIGIGSYLRSCGFGSKVHSNAVIINSQLHCFKNIGNNVHLKNVSMTTNDNPFYWLPVWIPAEISIGNNSTMENVFLKDYESVDIGQDSHLENINMVATGNTEAWLVFQDDVQLQNINLETKAHEFDLWDALIIPFFARINRNAWLTFKSGANIDLGDSDKIKIHFDVGNTNISSKEDLLKLQ